jgi:Uma2 family endonuclease
MEAYAILKVPEVWVYDNGRLKINLLQNGGYQESTTSYTFPDLPTTDLIPHLVQQALEQGTSTMLRQLRDQMNHKD